MPIKDDLFLLSKDTVVSIDTAIHIVDTVSSALDPLAAMHVPPDTPDRIVDSPATPTTAEIIREQAKKTYCRAI